MASVSCADFVRIRLFLEWSLYHEQEGLLVLQAQRILTTPGNSSDCIASPYFVVSSDQVMLLQGTQAEGYPD